MQPYSSSPQPYPPSYQSNIPGTPPLSPFPNPGQPQRKPELSKVALISLLALLVLIMFSGFGLIFYASVTRPAQFRARATATMQVIQTVNARATATVNAQATAIANATMTAQAHAQATATALQNMYSQATSGTPILASSLAFQTGSNWDVYDAVGGGGCGFAGSALHASVFQKSYYVPCFAHATNFANIALEVQMSILKGDEGGLIFRANDVTNQFYIFRVGHDGTYTLLVTRDNQHNTPILDDKSAAIKTGFGQINLLTVIAQGNNIFLYINKQFVASTTDGSYTRGEIGVFAGNGGHPTDVAFSNIRVWAL